MATITASGGALVEPRNLKSVSKPKLDSMLLGSVVEVDISWAIIPTKTTKNPAIRLLYIVNFGMVVIIFN